MKNPKKFARLSGQEDTGLSPAIFKSAAAGIQSGIYKGIACHCSTETAYLPLWMAERTNRGGGRWDLIIAHPPCTYLSNAGACRLYPHKGELDKDRYIKGLKGKEFFMAFWWYGYYGGRIVIENPVPSSVYELPKHTNVIQPYEFGEVWSKKTYLWEFGVPHLMPTEIVADHKPFLPSGTGRKLRGDTYGAKGCAHDGKPRAKTFPGIAKAMAEQWG